MQKEAETNSNQYEATLRRQFYKFNEELNTEICQFSPQFRFKRTKKTAINRPLFILDHQTVNWNH